MGVAIGPRRARPTLQVLTGAFSLAENAVAGAVAGAVGGKTVDSTLSVFADAGGRVALSGLNIIRGVTALDFETATSHSFTVRETLAGGANSPRDTVFSLAVTNVNDTNPTAFVFTDVTAVATGSVRTSNTITVAGLGASDSVTATVSGAATSTMSKNAGAFVAGPLTAVNGDTFAVRHTAAATGLTATNTTLTLGTTADTFTSTTA